MPNHTLSVEAADFGFSGGVVDSEFSSNLAASYALSFSDVPLRRAATISLGDLSLRLDRLRQASVLTDPRGRPSAALRVYWQRHCEAIEDAYNRLADAVTQIQLAYNAAAQAQTTATNAASTATAAATAVAEVQETVEAIQAGDLSLDSIVIDGTRFINDGGTLVAQP